MLTLQPDEVKLIDIVLSLNVYMKLIKGIILFLIAVISEVLPCEINADSRQPQLPKVVILGKPYYCYEASKGDSLFGIAQKFGWDITKVSELNSNLGAPIEKGSLIYYPAYDEEEHSENQAGSHALQKKIIHTVTSGETIYSISKAYGIPMERIYHLNPNARTGIKTGEKLIISEDISVASNRKSDEQHLTRTTVDANNIEDQEEIPMAVETSSQSNDYIYHKIEAGETLYKIARDYNTLVEDIYKLNPGLHPNEIHPEEILRLLPESRNVNIRYETAMEDQLVGIDKYKVKKGDTWSSVARKLGVDQQLLRESNPGKWKLKKGDEITVPITKEIEIEHAYIEEDPRELTSEGQKELYEEIHSKGIADGSLNDRQVRVAIVLDDTSSNRDMEFSRGALLAIDKLKNSPFKTAIKFLDGQSSMSKILTELETFRPDLVISTNDKNLPEYISDFARRTSTYLINAFDVRNESYIENPFVIQFLTPTSYFNDEIRDYITSRYQDYNLLIAGSPDSSDLLGELITVSMSGSAVPAELEISSLEEYPLEESGKYIIYGTPVKKDEIIQLLDKVITLKESNPLAEIVLLGRPNWITIVSTNAEKLSRAGAIIPSRFYFDSNDYQSKELINEYQELFGQTPIKSYPVYAVAGYDILRYFLPNVADTSGDFNLEFKDYPTLQSKISIKRVNNWGGILNPSCFMIRFPVSDVIEKVILP